MIDSFQLRKSGEPSEVLGRKFPESSNRDIRLALFGLSRSEAALVSTAFCLLDFNRTQQYCATCREDMQRSASGEYRS